MKQVQKPKKQNKHLEYSQELQDVFNYMCEVLAVEFPIELLTPEYLILSMLDRETHTLMILQSYLAKKEVNKLRKSYEEAIKKHIDNKTISVKIEDNLAIYTFNDECSRLLKLAEKEANKCFADAIYTEHVLLAILNEKNKFADKQIFSSLNLQYEDILTRCIKENNTDENPKEQSETAVPSKSSVGRNPISSTTEFIKQYTINLNQEYSDGKLDELVGREKELDEIITVLARRGKNNCILVGNGGCGKTSIVNGLVARIVNKQTPLFLNDKIVLKLNPMALISGTTLRGMLEERINGLCRELMNNDKFILFTDDIQQIIGESGSGDNDNNLSNMLNEILESGNVRVVATTNFKSYKKHIEPNPSMSRKMQKIVIEDTSIKETIDIITKSKERFESHHNVIYPTSVIKRCVELAKRYITTRSLPDSAFDVLDSLGARSQLHTQGISEITSLQQELNILQQQKEKEVNQGNFEFADKVRGKELSLKNEIASLKRKISKNKKTEITIDEVNECISQMSGVPIKNLGSEERDALRNIDKSLNGVVIGQQEAVEEVARVIKRNSVGLGDKKRVMGTFLFYGSTGVGKTLLAKELAKKIFGSEDSLIRIDMSEYSEKASMSKLIGTTAGYIGYDNGGGILTEAVKNHPYSVILLDEIEKANPEIYNLFLQLFDEGRLTDGSGTLVNFKNTIIIMTSNIGVKKAQELGGGIGFTNNSEANRKSIVEKSIKQQFSPEFLNRIDKLVYFNNLSEDNLKQIIRLEIDKLDSRLHELGHNLDYDDNTVSLVYEKIDKAQNFGARPVCRIIQTNLEDKITDLILDNDYEEPHKFHISVKEKEFSIQ